MRIDLVVETALEKEMSFEIDDANLYAIGGFDPPTSIEVLMNNAPSFMRP